MYHFNTFVVLLCVNREIIIIIYNKYQYTVLIKPPIKQGVRDNKERRKHQMNNVHQYTQCAVTKSTKETLHVNI